MKLTLILGTAASLFFVSCAEVPSAAGSEVPAPRINTAKIPVGWADPLGRPSIVVSPYRPYNLIDVKGYRSGDIVGDPSTAKISSSTGKPIASTAKSFRIP